MDEPRRTIDEESAPSATSAAAKALLSFRRTDDVIDVDLTEESTEKTRTKTNVPSVSQNVDVLGSQQSSNKNEHVSTKSKDFAENSMFQDISFYLMIMSRQKDCDKTKREKNNGVCVSLRKILFPGFKNVLYSFLGNMTHDKDNIYLKDNSVFSVQYHSKMMKKEQQKNQGSAKEYL